MMTLGGIRRLIAETHGPATFDEPTTLRALLDFVGILETGKQYALIVLGKCTPLPLTPWAARKLGRWTRSRFPPLVSLLPSGSAGTWSPS